MSNFNVMENLVESNSVLVLHLRGIWFRSIMHGDKLCEYRDYQKYLSRFMGKDGRHVRSFDFVVFALGYPSFEETYRWGAFHVANIDVGSGLPEWGGCPSSLYWRIWLGDRVDVKPWLSRKLLSRS